jgi:hypothetical protein
MPDRIAQQQSDGLPFGNCGCNHLGKGQDHRQKRGVAEFGGTVADCNLVGKFPRDRGQVLEGGNARKPPANSIEWPIDRAS